MHRSVLGIDLAKNVLQLHGVDAQGKVGVRKELTRPTLLPCVAQLAPCRLGMEACQSAHHWARARRKLGHDVRLISPPCVTPDRQSHKNARNDAAAICMVKIFKLAFPLEITPLPSSALQLVFRPTRTPPQRS